MHLPFKLTTKKRNGNNCSSICDILILSLNCIIIYYYDVDMQHFISPLLILLIFLHKKYVPITLELDAKCLIAAKASCTVYRLDNSIVQWGALN
jgi:hypothetical protein